MILQINLGNDKKIELNDIFSTLKDSFKDKKYSISYFGIGQGKSIIIGQSFNVGVRVYLKNNCIEIHQSFGNKHTIWLGVGAAILMKLNIESKIQFQAEVYYILRANF